MKGIFQLGRLPVAPWQQYWLDSLRQRDNDAAAALLLAHAHGLQLDQQPQYVAALAELLQALHPEAALPHLEQPPLVLNMAGANNAAQTVHIALAALLAAMQVPIVYVGDYGYDFAVGAADILGACGLAFPATPELIAHQLRKYKFAYAHLPHLFPSLQKFRQARQTFAAPSILDRVAPLLLPTHLPHIIGCCGWAEARFYAHFLQNNRHLLYDEHESPFISLCGDFYLQNDSDIEAMRLGDWQLARLSHNLSAQLRLATPQAAADFLHRLLDNQLGEDWGRLLITNAAFIAQIAQPDRNIQRSIMEAEAALSSRRALRLLRQLSGQNPTS